MFLFYLLSPFAHLILWLFAWRSLDEVSRDNFLRYSRKVVIFPHTTYWDYPILMLYIIANARYYHDDIYVIMKPQMFEGPFAWFFRSLNCLPATRREESGHGFVASMTKFFENKETFSLLISPEGTVQRAEWRTGYFYLAKSLNCPIQVIGLDYHRHCAVVKKAIFPGDLEKTQETLKSMMGSIPPLYPERSITSSPDVSTSLFGWDNLPIFLPILGFLLMRLILP